MTLDTMAWGQPEKSAAYLVPGDRGLLIDTGSARSAASLLRALGESDAERIEFIALTHVHPDQAGGAAVLAERFPEATFLVHPAGVPYLSDANRLSAAMEAIDGERAFELFGRPGSVPEARIRAVVDGDTVDLGDRQIEAIGAPGHTESQLAWFDGSTGALFCGDALGICIPGSRAIRPATPPDDFSYDHTLETIERLRRTGATSIWRAHFGGGRADPDRECGRMAEALERWHESFLEQEDRTEADEELDRRFNASLEAKLEPVPPAVRRSLELINPAWVNLAGMRAEREREGATTGRVSDAA